MGTYNRLQPYDMKLGEAAGGGSVWRLVNGYGGTDNNGNVLSQEITAPLMPPLRTVYKYDDFNRLALYAEGAANETAITCSGASAPLCEQFSYDAWGNRLIADRAGLEENGVSLICAVSLIAPSVHFIASEFVGLSRSRAPSSR